MKNKKLLVILIIFAIVVVLAVVCGLVFRIQNTELFFYSDDGVQVTPPVGAPTPSELLLPDFADKSIFVVSASKISEAISLKFPDYCILSVIKKFPNTISIYATKRVAVFSFEVNSAKTYLDVYGYVMSNGADNTIDITNCVTNEHEPFVVGKKAVFTSSDVNDRLQYLCIAVQTAWRVNYSFSDVTQLYNGGFVFTVSDKTTTMTISTSSGTKLIVPSVSINLEDRLIKVISIYNATAEDLRGEGHTITVDEKGRVVSGNN